MSDSPCSTAVVQSPCKRKVAGSNPAGGTIRTGAFRYARFSDIEQYHRDGWMMVAHLGPTHGLWSVLMWHCDCNRGIQ